MGYTFSVIEDDGSLTSYESDLDAVVEVQKQTAGDHIDIVAQPTP